MSGLVDRIRHEARQTARAAALGVIGTVFLLVGLGFLSVALWMIVAAQFGVLIAFEVLGGLYVLLGLLCLLLRPTATPRQERQPDPDREPAHPARAAQEDPFVKLATGFAAGLRAGRDARDARR